MAIKILDTDTINKIAAGEVVERPASVVKELVENSLDAGSKKISIRIERGGKRLIEVEDDGCGMSEEDAVLAFKEHATSKISHINDVFSLSTFGFRGEALPSIGSVAVCEMWTITSGSTIGTYLRIEESRLLKKKEVAGPPGTRVRVTGLFRNVPARLKHMGSDASEAAQIERVVKSFALAFPSVSFRLDIDGKTKTDLKAAEDMLERVLDLFGSETAKNTIEIKKESESHFISGLVGTPSLARRHPYNQYLYVNSRAVKSAAVAKVVKEAYGSLLPKVLNPFFIININLPPQKVDVNVSPTKDQVRFMEEETVLSFVSTSISEALSGSLLVPEVEPKTSSPQNAFQVSKTPHQITLEGITAQTSELEPNWGKEGKKEKTRQEEGEEVEEGQESEECRKKTILMKSMGAGTEAAQQEKNKISENIRPENEYEKYLSEQTPPVSLRPIGQILKTYILAEGSDERLYIIDQHAAHERIRYESLKDKKYEWMGKSQRLLNPVVVSLNESEMAYLEENMEVFSSVGFEIEKFGGRDVVVKAFPGGVRFNDPEKMLHTFLEDMMDRKRFETAEDMKDQMLHTIACHSAIRAGETLEEAQQIHLLKELAECSRPYTCPHGRPTTVALSKANLESMFKRSGF